MLTFVKESDDEDHLRGETHDPDSGVAHGAAATDATEEENAEVSIDELYVVECTTVQVSISIDKLYERLSSPPLLNLEMSRLGDNPIIQPYT